MNEEDLKRILNEALEPIKETQNRQTEILEKHTELLTSHTELLTSHTELLTSHTELLTSHTELLENNTKKLNSLWEQTVKLTEDHTETQGILESHSALLKRIEGNTEHNTANSERLHKRVQTLEGKFGIAPPAELAFIK